MQGTEAETVLPWLQEATQQALRNPGCERILQTCLGTCNKHLCGKKHPPGTSRSTALSQRLLCSELWLSPHRPAGGSRRRAGRAPHQCSEATGLCRRSQPCRLSTGPHSRLRECACQSGKGHGEGVLPVSRQHGGGPALAVASGRAPRKVKLALAVRDVAHSCKLCLPGKGANG